MADGTRIKHNVKGLETLNRHADESSQPEILAVRDGREGPVPTAWRETLQQIVTALAEGDFQLSRGIRGVAPVSAETATQIRDYVGDYGATLVALPEASWSSSICIGYGDHWMVLVDLWTAEEGRSDLVLQARVTEQVSEYLIAVDLVYVP